MELLSDRHPVTLERRYLLTITQAEIEDAYGAMTPGDREFIRHFDREDASIEERLMGLQIIARRVEEAAGPKEEA